MQSIPVKTHSVQITRTGFDPPAITVKLGDEVLWINTDDTSHSVWPWSGEIPPGEVNSLSFNQIGTVYAYLDSPNGVRCSVVVSG